MPTQKVILGEREVTVCANIPVLLAEFSLHLQYAQHRGKRPCKIVEVDNLETTWQSVFGVECISCESHPVCFFLIHSGYDSKERELAFHMLEQTRLRHIVGPLNAWERILDDETV